MEYEVAIKIGAILGATFGGAFATAQAKLHGTGQKLERLSEIAQKQKSKLKELKNQTQQLTKAFDKGVITEKIYGTAMQNIENRVRSLTSAQEKLKQKSAALLEIQNKYAALNYSRNMHRQSASAHATDFMARGAALYTMAAPIRSAIEFESVMADVKKVVDFGDEPEQAKIQFEQMGDQIIELSKSIPMSAEGLAQIVAAGGQAGIEKENLITFAESAAKMGVAFDITADQAGDMMAKWKTSFKMSQKEVNILADKINFLGNQTAASADKISQVVTRIGPLGEIGGVASGEIAALGASIVGSGVESEVAATGIKNMILGLTAGAGATKAQSEAFNRLGIDIEELASFMQRDAKGAILTVLEALKGLKKEQQTETLKSMFGKESIAAIAPLVSNLDNLKKNFEHVGVAGKYAGSMESEFATKSGTTANSWILLQSQFEATEREVGKKLLPAATGLLKTLSDIAKAAGQYPTVAAGILGVAAGLTALATVASGFGFIYHTLFGFIDGGRMAIQTMKDLELISKIVRVRTIAHKGAMIAWSGAARIAAAAQWLWNAALAVASSPVLLIIAAIGALIAIGYLLIQNWDTVKAWFSTLWDNPGLALEQFCDGVKNKFGDVLNWLSEKWKWITGIFSTPVEVSAKGTATSGEETKIYENAVGGIYQRGSFLTTFAEESPEAAIPIDGSARAIGLWERTGAMLGMYSASMEPERENNMVSGEISDGATGLWERTGAMLRGNTRPAEKKEILAPVHATFAPVITVQGNADTGQLAGIMEEQRRKFEEWLESFQHEQRRRSFA